MGLSLPRHRPRWFRPQEYPIVRAEESGTNSAGSCIISGVLGCWCWFGRLARRHSRPAERGATSFGATHVPACRRRMLWGIRSHFGRFRRYLLKSGEENKILNCGAQNYKFLFLHRLAVSIETSALGLAENVQSCNGWRSAGYLSPALTFSLFSLPSEWLVMAVVFFMGLMSRGLSERRGCQLVPI